MKTSVTTAAILLLGCDAIPAPENAIVGTGAEITIERYVSNRQSRSVCEVRGRLRNSGVVPLQHPIIGIEIYRGDQFLDSVETPLNIYPLSVGQSVPFDIPFICRTGGSRVRFTGRDYGRAITMVAPPF